MGIILKQSLKNSLIIYLGFIVGGINVIVLYPQILKSEFYGLVVYLLSASNLIMPLAAFGIHNTIVKFYSSYSEKEQQDRFLSIAIILPLFIAIPLGFFWNEIQNWILTKLPTENKIVESYTLSIYIIAISCAYFEVFYSWAKVQLQSVFGNILKEFYNRAVVCVLLLSISFGWITKPDFIWVLTGFYVLRTLLMMFYAFRLYTPKLSFQLPDNFKEILRYSAYIILAGSAGAIILDIDKVMIPSKEVVNIAAYYAVAVFIGSFIEAPSRAMSQILQPLTSKTLNENNNSEVENLYKKSSINLLLIGGLFFLLVNCGVVELFKLMPEKGYSEGVLVVLMISVAKLYNMFLGNNGAIINNSKFYRIALPIGVGMALSVYFLNNYLFEFFRTDGFALATLITILIFNTLKIFFVKAKFNMTPFTNKSIQLILVILCVFLVFYFWNFPFHPILNILFKSILIVVSYLFMVLKMNISPEIDNLIKRFIK
ncbi:MULTISPECIES: lipopolysaccharide biosynthesis protein [Tenacibaculum]|uniref:lipopolysaccharide biosynthesis protein n=2 Tax=Flavobacteriaceae TaxID=49546 RepID=UPI001F0A5EBC|nr:MULTISPECIES: oligosaccharide flippase family protein [Tenacibaculum]MCH3882443.1 oligosaccharide flippase family protein [Tenacibaculum aquimarinum]MDO6600075.1 oligosaccharide flippase family protein [Tenacibaculum sp. 1_MG-2023]